MIFEVKINCKLPDLDLFPNSEHHTIVNHNYSTMEPDVYHTWYVHAARKQDVMNILVKQKLTEGMDINFKIKRVSKNYIKSTADRLEFYSQPPTLEELIKLSNINATDLPKDEPKVDLFGKSVECLPLRDILRKIGQYIIGFKSSLDNPDIPNTGFIVVFDKIDAVTFDKLNNFFRKMECGVCISYYDRAGASYLILETLDTKSQTQYKLSWDQGISAYWFYNDPLNDLKKLAGI